MMKHSDYLKRKQSLVLENGSLSPELLDFYMKIFLAQEEFILQTSGLPVYSEKFRSGAYQALSSDGVKLDDEIKSHLFNLMIKISEIITGSNPGMDFSDLKLNFKNDAEAFLRGLLKQDFSFLETKAKENHLALDEFIFLIHNIFKPFMVTLKEKSDIKIDKEDWLEGTCPFCGYLPDMSKIVESKENRRILHCAICECEWEFPRLLCPACGCKDQEMHGFFEYEDNSLYRVYYCDECRHYIKSVRIPKLQEESKFDLTVEDIITNFLDASMINKGYKRI